MSAALIGYTGFVGGNLRRQAPFDAVYSSSDIHTIAGRHFDLMVCAGAPGAKWRANREPQADRASVQSLMDHLAQAEADRAVLISTVDVYPEPRGVDEGSSIDEAALSPYGWHRRLLERFVAGRFETTVVRLPGLFGPGLKKNAIYDLLHGHDVDRLCPRSVYQLYDLADLWRDIGLALEQRLAVLNLATEPVALARVATEVFGIELRDDPALAPARYDVRTRHAGLWGRADGYVKGAGDVVGALTRFVGGAASTP